MIKTLFKTISLYLVKKSIIDTFKKILYQFKIIFLIKKLRLTIYQTKRYIILTIKFFFTF